MAAGSLGTSKITETRRDLGECAGGDDDDRYQIALMLEHLQRGKDDKFEQRLRRMTRMLVRRHRPLIERTACDLIKAGKLSGDQVDAIMPKMSLISHRPLTPSGRTSSRSP
jgi:hypothetical protein